MKDNTEFIRKCNKCHRHSRFHHALSKIFHFTISPWPFYQWGMYVFGLFPLSIGLTKVSLVGVDFFTKWIKLRYYLKSKWRELDTSIESKLFSSLVCQEILSQNKGIEFFDSIIVELCHQMGIQTNSISIIHRQANGKAKSTNKVILYGIKKKLDDTNDLGVELFHDTYYFFSILSNLTFSRPIRIFVFNYSFCEVLRPYHTTSHSTTKGIPFNMVYGIDVMLLVEINMPTCGVNISTKTVKHVRRWFIFFLYTNEVSDSH